MPRRGSFTWDRPAGRYRDSSGRFVSPVIVRRGLDRALDVNSAEMREITQLMRDGNISLSEWRELMRASIKESQLYSAAIAKGGFAQMRAADYGRVGRIIRDQYEFLENFAREIRSGRQSLDGTSLSRAAMYGQSPRPTYEAFARADAAARGMNQERNILHKAEHCTDCLAMSALGWQPINTLIPIGQRKCRANDRCTMRYRSA